MNTDTHPLSFQQREALKQELFSQLRCALPGNVVSYDPDTRTATIQPAVKTGSLLWPLLKDVPVFMPIPFEVAPGAACLVIFADIDIDAWLASGAPEEPPSPRKHSLSDGFAFIGFRTQTSP